MATKLTAEQRATRTVHDLWPALVSAARADHIEQRPGETDEQYAARVREWVQGHQSVLKAKAYALHDIRRQIGCIAGAALDDIAIPTDEAIRLLAQHAQDLEQACNEWLDMAAGE